jgi:hypothetical protein
MTGPGARFVVVVAAVVAALAAVGVILGLLLSHRKARPGADVHLASCTIMDGVVTARGIARNRTADTQVVDVLVGDAGSEAGTEIVAPAHGTAPFSVSLDGGQPPCVVKRARVVQSVTQGTRPGGGPAPPGSVPTR